MESLEKKLSDIDIKVIEFKDVILGNIELEPMEGTPEESVGDKVSGLLQEEILINGEDYAKELCSKLKTELNNVIESDGNDVDMALKAIADFEKDKGWD